MENIIEVLKAKKESLDLESKTIEAVVAYLVKIGVVSINGNGCEKETKKAEKAASSPIPNKPKTSKGFIYFWHPRLERFIKRKKWGTNRLEAKTVGRPKKTRKGK